MYVNRHRFLLVFLLIPLLLTGCAQRGSQRVGLEDVSNLATDALLGALLGTPAAQRVTMMGNPDPALLEKGGAEKVVLATDIAGFVQVSKGALTDTDLKLVEADVVRSASAFLKKRDFSVISVPFTKDIVPETPKTLVATFTPVTEEGGSPEEKRTGKGRTYVLIRLTISDPDTHMVLRVRDFYSGRDAGIRP